MSDRTRVSGQGEAGVTDDDAATTRADRIMGREPDQKAGSSQRRPDPRSGGNGSARVGSTGAESAGSTDTQRATAVPGPSGASDSTSRRRPTDGWGRTSGSASRESTAGEDETPTRVNPVVPSFRTPPREGASSASAAPATSGPATSGSAASGSAASGSATSGSATSTPAAPGSAAASPATGATAKTAVGSGSLGAVVTESMEAPPADQPAEPAQPRPRTKPRKARRARLRLSRVDPWSMMKTSFLFSIALGIAAWVAVAFVWWVIQQSGLFTAVNETVSGILQTPGDADPFRLEAYVNGSRVLGLTALLAVVDVILITALMTVASFLYNLSATMLGGLQVTLAETDD